VKRRAVLLGRAAWAARAAARDAARRGKGGGGDDDDASSTHSDSTFCDDEEVAGEGGGAPVGGGSAPALAGAAAAEEDGTGAGSGAGVGAGAGETAPTAPPPPPHPRQRAALYSAAAFFDPVSQLTRPLLEGELSVISFDVGIGEGVGAGYGVASGSGALLGGGSDDSGEGAGGGGGGGGGSGSSRSPSLPLSGGAALAAALRSLRTSSVPSQLPCREGERASILSMLTAALRGGGGAGAGGGGGAPGPTVIYVSGMPGTGKTATVTECVRALRGAVAKGRIPHFRYVEVNAMKLPNPYAIYAVLWRALGGEALPSSRALPALEGWFSSAAKRARKGEGGPGATAATLLVVDELDYLVTQKQSVLYNLFEWSLHPGSPLVVVAIANTMDMPERLMPKVASRMGLARVTFAPYTPAQLETILASRLAGIPSFDPASLAYTSKKVAAISGDVRRALQLARRSLELAAVRGAGAGALGGASPFAAALAEEAAAGLGAGAGAGAGEGGGGARPAATPAGKPPPLGLSPAASLPLTSPRAPGAPRITVCIDDVRRAAEQLAGDPASRAVAAAPPLQRLLLMALEAEGAEVGRGAGGDVAREGGVRVDALHHRAAVLLKLHAPPSALGGGGAWGAAGEAGAGGAWAAAFAACGGGGGGGGAGGEEGAGDGSAAPLLPLYAALALDFPPCGGAWLEAAHALHAQRLVTLAYERPGPTGLTRGGGGPVFQWPYAALVVPRDTVQLALRNDALRQKMVAGGVL
jgi:Cdc6-like AAA superfamily ATPase